LQPQSTKYRSALPRLPSWVQGPTSKGERERAGRGRGNREGVEEGGG